MRNYILVSLLVITCNAAWAEWRQVAGGVNATGYADADSIRRNGALATMRVLLDYTKPPFDGNNLPYRSLTMSNEYHCEDGRFRVLSITSHAGNMGQGERPFTTDEAAEWEAVTNASIQRDLWKLACAKAELPAKGTTQQPAAPAGQPVSGEGRPGD